MLYIVPHWLFSSPPFHFKDCKNEGFMKNVCVVFNYSMGPTLFWSKKQNNATIYLFYALFLPILTCRPIILSMVLASSTVVAVTWTWSLKFKISSEVYILKWVVMVLVIMRLFLLIYFSVESDEIIYLGYKRFF
jgi:hypothetical protein